MSKAVKGVARGIGKVVKGVVNVVKKVAKSKLGKIIIGAALVYFGGAALMGGFSSAAAGGSFLSGASAGLSSAASGISGAWSALTAGNIGGAGTALSSGFTGASAAGTAAAGGVGASGSLIGVDAAMGDMVASTTASGSGMAGGGGLTGVDAAMSDMVGSVAAPSPGVGSGVGGYAGATPADALSGYDQAMVDLANSTPPVNTAAAKPGLIGRAADWFSSLKPSQQVMVAQMGGGLVSTGLKAYGAYKTGQEQQQMQEDARRRYNANIGGYRYGG